MLNKSSTEYKSYREIEENKKIFLYFIKKLDLESDDNEKIRIAKSAIQFALKNITGFFCSYELEKIFIDIAQRNSVKLTSEFKSSSFLHVVTQMFNTGGHSRVVERWIKNSPDFQTHSVVLLGQDKDDVPELVRGNVLEKGGELIDFSHIDNLVEKGIALRRLGMAFEYVILHVDMDDLTPLIAFGTEDFARPVLFVNHADHQFWVGGSISDTVVNLRNWGKELNVRRRGIQHNSHLEIPVESNTIPFFKAEFKKELGLGNTDTLILTIGSDYKYSKVLGYDFIGTVGSIIDRYTNAYLIAIGPSPKNSMWMEANIKSGGKIRAIGTVPYDKIYSCIKSCDLYLDSFPFFGGTTLIDVVYSGVPALSLETASGQSDFVAQSVIACKNTDELIEKSFKIIDDSEYARWHSDISLASLASIANVDSWRTKLNQILSKISGTHEVKQISPVCDPEEIDLLLSGLVKNIKKPKNFIKKLKNKLRRDILILKSNITINRSGFKQ